MNSKTQRIADLVKKIKAYQKSYYNGEAEISDSAFDDIWDELAILDPNNEVLKKVGADNTDGFEKKKHIIPMCSQDKATTSEAFMSWFDKEYRGSVLAQYKLDGASIELQYIDSVFTAAVTRGDGTIGDDITENVSKMSGVVLKLPTAFTGGIRGEVLMSHKTHLEHFSTKANCRNAANGCMKRKDGDGCEYLDIIVYDAMSTGSQPFTDELSKMDWLKLMGFSTVECVEFNESKSIVTYRDMVDQTRSKLPYDIDGLVIKMNEIDWIDMYRARPERQIAFKFNPEEAMSVLRGCEWSVSGATRTPIAMCDPVHLAGTTVERANLCNPGIIRRLKIGIGSKIVITKRGEIIPKIERVVPSTNKITPITIPSVCDCCGTKLIDADTILYCPNEQCDNRIIHRIEKWIDTVGIKEIGPSTLIQLYTSGLVKSIYDLYQVSSYNIANLERIGEVMANKIYKSIHKTHTVTLAQLVSGFDIDGIGETIVTKLVRAGFGTLDKLREASELDLLKVDGVGPITARLLSQGLATHGNDMQELSSIITITSSTIGPLTGKSFCFTGELISTKRSTAEARIKTLGGVVRNSVTEDLTYLVTNNPDSGSAKNEKAKKYGILIINEETLLPMLN